MNASNGGFLPSLTSFFRRLFVDKPNTLTYSTSMAIRFDDEYKNQIGCKITVEFSEAIKNREIPDHELELVSDYVVKSLNDVKTHTDLFTFLRNLAVRWPSFTSLYHSELEQVKTGNNIQDKLLNRNK